MVYTVTLNPAIDYVVRLDSLAVGETNHCREERVFFGGKGINVSMVLKALGVPSVALGFAAGATGAALERGLQDSGIRADLVHLEQGMTRINVKIRGGQETAIDGRGPEVPEVKLEELLGKIDALVDGDTIVLAGSIPGGMDEDVYRRILKRLAGKQVRAVVDTTGECLRGVLPYKPFLVKPNHLELGALLGRATESTEEVIRCARQLQALGAVNVLVSRAERGAVLLDAFGRVHIRQACPGTAVSSVGAGDSMVAGFLAGFREGDYAAALELGIAAGAATAFSEGLATGAQIRALLGQSR